MSRSKTVNKAFQTLKTFKLWLFLVCKHYFINKDNAVAVWGKNCNQANYTQLQATQPKPVKGSKRIIQGFTTHW